MSLLRIVLPLAIAIVVVEAVVGIAGGATGLVEKAALAVGVILLLLAAERIRGIGARSHRRVGPES